MNAASWRAPAGVASAAALLLAVMAWRGERWLLVFASMGDTWEYLDAAAGLAAGSLPKTIRTLGYPAFLAVTAAPIGILGVLAAQVVLLGWTVWRVQGFAARLAPDARPGAHQAAAALVGLFCLGHSVTLMTDFLCALAVFSAFDAGLRDRRGAAFGWGLAAALLRPTWAMAPPVVLLLALWDRRSAWWALLAGLVLGLGLSVAHQRHTADTWRPSRVVTMNLRGFTQTAAPGLTPTFDALRGPGGGAGSEPADADRGGAAPPQRRGDLEAFARRVASAPAAHARLAAGMVLRYTLAPVERPVHIVWQMSRGGDEPPDADSAVQRSGDHPLPRWVRAICFVLTLPALLLLAWPAGRRRDRWILPMGVGLFLVLVSTIAPFQGERMRLPAVLLLAGNAAANLEHLVRRWWRR